ncbi:MAG: UDP-N-acetylglucosamine--N-acetylmuramyl-(pentapeptide) pyrophosphoryl-undecaprenol [Clostridia bacterium]|jgi:UDP-N-acetylglucosamine--N-acetylmuramyl-(pentapeptide) pyrophosphoryl-undecaprenol N-acetylglucosamine transferase|nr:UDP-N-acetylglucosamine--N-acetylmuramyl-(pentapeptide) pyrophosphoryl-undecaprenol [Clostridia bacterium]MDN5322151.1 UDP-N-acetylglucosamine--N-acetylmuramyl-(pentapeptide) pyrophosphoryl-undecaprenol [Clostridia bacterium]
MRVLFTGGGTGGHVYPAVAIAQNLLKKYPNSEVLYVGTKGGMESKIVPQTGLNFKTIEVEGWQRKFSWQALRAGLKAIQGGTQALNIIRKFNPQVVIGTGGYVCGPVVLAASLLKIPTIIHEQNALPGLTNRTLAKLVNKIMITFPESAKYFLDSQKVVLTGLPVRDEIFKITKSEGLDFFNLQSGKITLLVSGGSRGAKSINNAIVSIYQELLQIPNLQIIHATGEQGYYDVINQLALKGINIEEYGNLILKPYIYNMEYALKAADLCIARAGATFLAEITAIGLPGILIPYPYAAENHQEFNARSLVNLDAAIMILDKDLKGNTLFETVRKLINHPERLVEMSDNIKKAGNPDSMEKIMRVLEETIG